VVRGEGECGGGGVEGEGARFLFYDEGVGRCMYTELYKTNTYESSTWDINW
jgi:hypothetical protein